MSLEEFFWLLYWFLRVSDLLRMHKELSRSIFLLHQCWIQRQQTPLYMHFLSILAWQYRKIFVNLWPDQKTQKEACEINVHAFRILMGHGKVANGILGVRHVELLYTYPHKNKRQKVIIQPTHPPPLPGNTHKLIFQNKHNPGFIKLCCQRIRK